MERNFEKLAGLKNLVAENDRVTDITAPEVGPHPTGR